MIKNKILIIDDDAGFIESASQALEKNGYEVICAHTGCEGFGKAKHEVPDLVIMDVVLANKAEGVELCGCMHSDAALKDIPIIMVAAQGYASLADGKTNLVIKSVMEKPINPQELVQAVRTYISRTGEKHRAMVDEVTKLVKQWEGKKGSLIMILHELQNHYGYVPRDVAFVLSEILDVSLAQIYEVITFYNFFKLTPPGKNSISVCLGTACYLKGAPQLVEEFKKELGINEGESTKDGLFYLQIVRCLGCCGLAPVVMINSKVYGKVTRSEVKNILNEYRKG
jgi:NADH-quinone oxidoreductase subunit E